MKRILVVDADTAEQQSQRRARVRARGGADAVHAVVPVMAGLTLDRPQQTEHNGCDVAACVGPERQKEAEWMAADIPCIDLEALVARLAATDDAAARARVLKEAVDPHTVRDAAERLNEEADRARYQDIARSLRWSGDIITLGTLADAPTVVALGYMSEAFTFLVQGRNRDSLARFDEAAALFRAHGDEVGWARTQIGRTGSCVMLGLFDEALERAREARAILERAGDRLRVASIDTNLALLLERMNRPAEALAYSERALAAYHSAGLTHRAVATLSNHALLLWRLGRVREALDAHREARQGLVSLGATVDAAREDLNIGAAYVALGHYAEAVSTLTDARKVFLAAEISYSAALTGLYLAECFTHLGRYRDAIAMVATLRDEFTHGEATVEYIQLLVWEALSHSGLGEHEAAVHTLDTATGLLPPDDGLASYRASLDVQRARLLLEGGRISEVRALLEAAIPPLRQAGLTMEVTTAQILWGSTLVEEGRPADAHGIAGEALDVAEREGLDWLAARALHLRGRAAIRMDSDDSARADLTAAIRRLDRVNRRVAWDDRTTFSGTAAAVYTDAVALALRQGRATAALSYAERAKSRALADHLRARIDVRPRAHDDSSHALVDELNALRDRYAWLGAIQRTNGNDRGAPPVAVRWATSPAHDAAARDEAVRIERRMAEIWRELQASNPAYRGEAAALDLVEQDEEKSDGEDEAIHRWAQRLHTALGRDDAVALLEYVALGDDLVLFVVRAGEVRTVRLAGAATEVRRLVPLWRINVERSAAAVSGGAAALRALGANARGVLQRLHAVLLAPAAPLLHGVTRLAIVPHGTTHHVPFHALYDGAGYLLEHHEVGYSPCAGLVEHFDERHRQVGAAGPGDAREALVLCCSDGGALPHVRIEGQAITAALGGRLLSEEEATLSALRDLSPGCSVIHLAAHGVFRPDEPLFSSLQLHDGRLSTLEVFELELRCSLVTLSACETSLGMAGAGDELMGLSRAFLYAGAPSLILSLWKVEDRSTAVLMDRFYKALRRGESKAAALQQAQLALLRNEVDGAGDLSAPFFWAPFQLIGHAGPL